MGRYDRIRVYQDGWKQPTRIKVYSGGWKDLGAATGYTTTPLYAFRSGSAIRATLNREDYTVTGEHYSYGIGAFKEGLTEGGAYGVHYGEFCWNPGSADWPSYIAGTIRKTSDTDQVVFKSSDYNSTNNYVQVIWQADGRLRFDVRYNGNTVKSLTSSNAVSANNWVYFQVYANARSWGITMSFNNVNTSATIQTGFLGVNKTNQIGDTYMQFKNDFSVSLSAIGWGDVNLACSRTINCSSNTNTNSQLSDALEYYNGDYTATRWV